jgi:Tfp pilus assembly protein PilF
MKDAADQVKTSCEPAVLEAHAGVVKAKIKVAFPEKFFHPEAVLEILPVVKYNGGELPLPAYVKMLQGEKVKDNYTVIPEKTGGSYEQELMFNFNDSLKVSQLTLRATLILKGNVRLPILDRKVADGVVVTYKQAEVLAVPAFSEDAYVKTSTLSKNAEIKFVINQAAVRPAELSKEDVKLLQNFLVEASKDSKKTLKGLSISSYASPDGATTLNEKLSSNRGKTSTDALNSQLQKAKVKIDGKLVAVEHTAEDWEGFQELMAASDIQDKDLVLRVLSMYNDPDVREREIKNIAAVYKVIADKILPDLRRSKLQATVEMANLGDDEIKALVDAGTYDKLSVEQLLYAGNNLYTADADKEKAYKAASALNDFRAWNNLGAIYLKQGKVADATAALESAQGLNGSDAKVKNNLGYALLLTGGKTAEADQLLASAGLDESKQGLAYIAIQKGEYAQAVTLTKGSKTVNEALAQLLNGDLDEASSVLADLDTPKASYLKAVVGARKNSEADVLDNLNKAGDLKAEAKTDAEFAAFWPKIQ